MKNAKEGVSQPKFIKKRLWHRCFSVNFAKFLRQPFLQNNSERLLLKFSSPRLQKDTVTLFVTVILKIFMRQTLTDDFWGLQNNMNCTFPLMYLIFCR